MRGIFLDNRIKSNDIDETYFGYMKKFLSHRNIAFEKALNGKYVVNLNENRYLYAIDKNKIMKKEENLAEKVL